MKSAAETIASIKRKLKEASTSEMARVIQAFNDHGWFQIDSKDTRYGHYCFRKKDTYAYVNDEALQVTYFNAMTDKIVDEHSFGSIDDLIDFIE